MSSMAGDDLVVRASLRDELTAPLARVKAEVESVGDSTASAGRKASLGSRGFDKMAAGVGKMAKVAGKAAVYGVAGLTIGLGAAAAAAAYVGITTAASMETAKIGFTTMLGSAKKADAFLRDLADFAATTPFEFPELQDAASSLVSAGVATKDVIPIMRTLGDVTAGMGTGSEGIQRATVAIQQMNAAQKISAEDLGQLRDAGIPVYDLLAGALGKSKKEVSALVQAGKLGAPELKKLMGALTTGKGLEKFNGLMEKQSHTLTGVTSTLKDTVQMGLAKAFAPLIPIIIKYTLKLSDLAQKAMPMVETGLRKLIRFSRQLGSSFKLEGLDGVAKDLEQAWGVDVTGVLDTARQVIDDVVTVITKSLVPAVNDVVSVLPGWATPMGALNSLLGFMADHTTTTHVALTALVAVLTVAKAITLGMAAAQVVKNVADGIALARLMMLTPGTLAYTVAAGAATVGTTLWGVATTVAAGAMAVLTSPITLVVAAIALLVGGLILAYKKSDTFKAVVDGAFKAVGAAGRWLWNEVLRPVFKFLVNGFAFVMDMYAKMLDGLSHVPGFGWAKKAADAMHNGADKAREMADGINRIPDNKHVSVHYDAIVPSNAQLARVDAMLSRGSGGRIIGDTHTSRAKGRGNLAGTFAAHAAISRASGARTTITNVLTGGGGKGYGSGDHQAGRALDLTGTGLGAYAKATREAGGYAAFHGNGPTRHLHAVPAPMGDTTTSHARPRHLGGQGGGNVTIAPGAVLVKVENPTANVDVSQAVKDGIEAWMRDHEERR